MEVERLPNSVDPIALVAHPDLEEAGMITIDGWTVVVGTPLTVLADLDGLSRLDSMLHWRAASAVADDPVPFASGAVGWVGDDISRRLLGLAGEDPRPSTPTGGIRFGLHDSAVCIAPDGTSWVAASDVAGVTRDPVAARLSRWRELVESAPSASGLPPAPSQPLPVGLSVDARAHAAAVGRAKGWIGAGDLYQLNLTLQVTVGWQEATTLARRLFAASAGAAHRAWLRSPGGVDVVSISPETFLRVDGPTIITRPIKGTRPRRDDPAADRQEAADLIGSAKDRAEHIMIVDLERNDLGRICEVGSVTVPDLLTLERHPTVWHLASTVAGRLRADTGLLDVLSATFPPGSVTGAPKRMAWQRISELEPVRRGVYCGAIGAFTPSGCDLSVAIRTAVLTDGEASYGTGGGIVADSTSAAEWAEAMDKARAFASATGALLPSETPGGVGPEPPATGPRPSRSCASRSAC
jgi:para-aminobenzoate synthetase component I